MQTHPCLNVYFLVYLDMLANMGQIYLFDTSNQHPGLVDEFTSFINLTAEKVTEKK